MSPPGHLYLRRLHGAPLLFLLGLLPALLQLGAQGLPRGSAGLLPAAAHAARRHLGYGSLKPAAHLVGDPRTKSWLRWRANSDQGFLLNGFALSNNSLLVPASGLYFVYSQVVFSGQSHSPKVLYLSHEVQVLTSRYSSRLPLLSAHKNVDPGPEGHWMRSMYQGAVFLLTKGDQLSTHTEGLPYLFLSPSSVFFGAFAL